METESLLKDVVMQVTEIQWTTLLAFLTQYKHLKVKEYAITIIESWTENCCNYLWNKKAVTTVLWSIYFIQCSFPDESLSGRLLCIYNIQAPFNIIALTILLAIITTNGIF